MASILGQLFVELGINTAAFKEGLDKSTYQARQFASETKSALGDLGKSVGQLGSMFGNLGGEVSVAAGAVASAFGVMTRAAEGFATGATMAGGAAVIALIGLAGGAAAAAAAWAYLGIAGADVVEKLERMSAKTGLSISDLQAFGAAAQNSGGDLQDIATAFKKFERALSDSNKEGSASNIIMHNLGVTAKEPKEAFLQTVDALEAMTDVNLRANYAQALFGRSFQDLLADLPEGSKNFREAVEQVDQYGAKIGGEAISATENYKKSVTDLSLSFDKLKVSATGALNVIAYLARALAADLHPIDTIKTLLNITPDNGPGKPGTPGGAAGPARSASDEAANQKAFADKAQAAQDAYLKEKDYGEAGLALEKQQLLVAEALKAQDYDRAAALEKTIPYLQEAAALEKQRFEAILHLPKTGAAAVNKDDIEVTKALSSAVKDLGGAAGIEAAALEDVKTKQAEFGAGANAVITDTKQFAAELARLSQGFRETSLAVEIAKAIGTTGKALEEFTGKQKAATTALEEQAKSLGRVSDEQAKNTAELEPFAKKMQAAREAFATYNAELAANGVMSEKAQQHQAALAVALAQATAAYNTADEAVKKHNAEIQAQAASEGLKGVQATAGQAQATADAVLKGGEAYAKIDEEVRKYAQDTKATAEQQAAFRAALEQTRDAGLQLAIVQEVLGEGQKAQDLAKQIADLQAISNTYAAEGKNVDALTKGILKLEAEQAKMQEASGSITSGIHAGYLQWASDIKTNAQLMDSLTVTALNGITNNFTDMIVKGKANWRDLIQSMEKEIVSSGISRLLQQSLGALSGLSGSNNGFLSSLGSIFKQGGQSGQQAALTADTTATTTNTTAVTANTAALNSLASSMASSMASGSGGGAGGGGLLDGLLGGGGDASDSGDGGMDFGGGFAGGGDMTPGKTYLVGEKGPELIKAGVSGTVIPNAAVPGMGGDTHVTMNVNTPDANSFGKSSSQLIAGMYRQVNTSVARNK